MVNKEKHRLPIPTEAEINLIDVEWTTLMYVLVLLKFKVKGHVKKPNLSRTLDFKTLLTATVIISD